MQGQETDDIHTILEEGPLTTVQDFLRLRIVDWHRYDETGRALCSKHSGPADVATQGYRWSNLWNLEDISLIAEQLSIPLADLYLLETWWRPVPMQAAMPGLVVGNGAGRPVFVDLGYQAEIDGRTAIVWSENFGEVIYAQWVLAASESNDEKQHQQMDDRDDLLDARSRTVEEHPEDH